MPFNRYSYQKEKISDLEKFCKRYRIQARQGRTIRRPEPISYKPYTFEDDFRNVYINTVEMPTYDLNITEEDFKQLLNDLAEMDSEEYNEYVRLRKSLGEHFVVDLYGLKSQQERERRIRATSPGVQKAWENYQLMLKLAGG